jgi:hypothetical protein
VHLALISEGSSKGFCSPRIVLQAEQIIFIAQGLLRA